MLNESFPAAVDSVSVLIKDEAEKKATSTIREVAINHSLTLPGILCHVYCCTSLPNIKPKCNFSLLVGILDFFFSLLFSAFGEKYQEHLILLFGATDFGLSFPIKSLPEECYLKLR